MKSWKLAVSYYLCGYLIATIGGFGSYFLLSETAMWVFTMTVMPVVFTWLGYRYFTDSRAASERLADCELVRLTGLWIVLSMTLDAVIYVFITPMVLGFPVNWSFFQDASPWIWLNYVTIVLITTVAKCIYLSRRRKLQQV